MPIGIRTGSNSFSVRRCCSRRSSTRGSVARPIGDDDMTTTQTGSPIVELENVGKSYGAIRALRGISVSVHSGEVTCILGDNGAGKSTLIKIVSGFHAHDEGSYRVDGKETRFATPRQALDLGIATVYQDLAMVPLMPVWRNFFLGSEISTGVRPFRQLAV